MTNPDKKEATCLIEDFLVDNLNPNTSDWKRLIDANPQYAGAIADAAVIHGSVETDEIAAHTPFNEKVFNATISYALNLVHQTSGPVLELAEQKVDSIKGPAVKQIAENIGIGPYASLLNGVLVGRTLAPKQILAALSAKLEVPIAALAELFQRTFATSTVPAFKSPNGKPEVKAYPSTWEQAVRSMKLSAEETNRLLMLSEEE